MNRKQRILEQLEKEFLKGGGNKKTKNEEMHNEKSFSKLIKLAKEQVNEKKKQEKKIGKITEGLEVSLKQIEKMEPNFLEIEIENIKIEKQIKKLAQIKDNLQKKLDKKRKKKKFTIAKQNKEKIIQTITQKRQLYYQQIGLLSPIPDIIDVEREYDYCVLFLQAKFQESDLTKKQLNIISATIKTWLEGLEGFYEDLKEEIFSELNIRAKKSDLLELDHIFSVYTGLCWDKSSIYSFFDNFPIQDPNRLLSKQDTDILFQIGKTLFHWWWRALTTGEYGLKMDDLQYFSKRGLKYDPNKHSILYNFSNLIKKKNKKQTVIPILVPLQYQKKSITKLGVIAF
ncbi:structural maintenance of chromosomes protein [Anaeramoeba flamelloides]|uniref:Structural maintenance of chromosomes protein n=1 Tax=Anaeramoeba flamelloides TaxID=1746091 RepID=A0AAV7YSZ4_9EUKA|nr:structural maintenance of chromosomes protein [Anaeramoeba flamelloides]